MSKLTPGERAINWAKALAIIVPLFGVGVFAGNTETVHKWLAGPDEIVPVEVDQNQHNAKINAKFLEIEERIEQLEAELERADSTNYARLKSRIIKLERWHGN